MPGIHPDITSAFGDTPLVRLNRVAEGVEGNILAKLEFYNPASSVKDRLGIAIVDAAEASGQLQPGGTIVEATSGNTGIALAMVGAARGYRVVLAMPSSMSIERRLLLEGLRRRARPHRPRRRHEGRGRQGRGARRRDPRRRPGAASSRTRRTRAIHRKTTAEEILRDTDGKVDYFVAGIGTGGTITGVGQVLKERVPGAKVIAVEPADAGDGAAGADAGDEIVDLAVGVADDLLGGGLAVDRAGSPRSRTGWARIAPGVSATISSALATAPFMPPAGSVRTSSAPYALSSRRRSIDIEDGIARMTR